MLYQFAAYLLLSKSTMTAIRYFIRRELISVATAGLMIMMSSADFSAQAHPLDDPYETSREEWRIQINAARARLDTMRRERKSLVPRAPTPEEVAEEASRRILEDESLRPGDVVSTNQGLFQFQGSHNGERRPEDFVKIR